MTKKILLSSILILCITACKGTSSPTEASTTTADTMQIAETDVMAGINLTVSESKRLIAKGFCNIPEVQERLKKGMIILTRGTTNTYIAEELVGLKAPHGSFLTGHFVPQGTKALNKGVAPTEEIILIDGKQTNMKYTEALKRLQEGDIVVKGGNLLNYHKKQAAVCIGAPDGGTTYRFLPYVGKGKAQLIIPIGLEKETSGNLSQYEQVLALPHEKLTFLPKIHLFQTVRIFTEIEALKQIANVKVLPFGVGGVAGREGGISLAVIGTKGDVDKILQFIQTIQGERRFEED